MGYNGRGILVLMIIAERPQNEYCDGANLFPFVNIVRIRIVQKRRVQNILVFFILVQIKHHPRCCQAGSIY